MKYKERHLELATLQPGIIVAGYATLYFLEKYTATRNLLNNNASNLLLAFS